MHIYECPNCGGHLAPTDDPDVMRCENCSSMINISKHRKDAENRMVEKFEDEEEMETNRNAVYSVALKNGLSKLSIPEHPFVRDVRRSGIIVAIIIVLFMVSCIAMDATDSSSAKSEASLPTKSSQTNIAYQYDEAYTRISAEDNSVRYYYLIDSTNHVVAFVTTKNNSAILTRFASNETLSTGITCTYKFSDSTIIHRQLQYSKDNNREIIVTEDSGEQFSYVKTSVDGAEKALDQASQVRNF